MPPPIGECEWCLQWEVLRLSSKGLFPTKWVWNMCCQIWSVMQNPREKWYCHHQKVGKQISTQSRRTFPEFDQVGFVHFGCIISAWMSHTLPPQCYVLLHWFHIIKIREILNINWLIDKQEGWMNKSVEPERATRSISSSPWRLNNVIRFSMVEFGAGMLVFEMLKLAVLESLLPNGSSQLGPPLCFPISI